MVGIDAAGNRGLDTDDNRRYSRGGYKSDNGRLSYGYLSFIGKRPSMEDFYDIKASEVAGQPAWMFGVFDGHGGARAARFLKENLFENLFKHPNFITNTELAISETFQQTDIDFLESIRDTIRDDGSTASTAVLIGNRLYVANVGDSRTIISKDGIAIPLSDDHKPNRIDERRRIESFGGRITWSGTLRVGGILAMTRAFGNRTLKRFVVAEPEIRNMEIWDVVSNEDVVSIVNSEEDPETGARKLTEAAFSRGSSDNITCMVIKLHHIMKSDSEKDPFEKSDSEEDPFMKVDQETGPIDADQELKDPITKSDPEEIQSMDVDMETELMEAGLIRSMKDPNQMSDPEEMKDSFQMSDTDTEKMKNMKVEPENGPIKTDPEIVFGYSENVLMKTDDPEDCMHVQFLEA